MSSITRALPRPKGNSRFVVSEEGDGMGSFSVGTKPTLPPVTTLAQNKPMLPIAARKTYAQSRTIGLERGEDGKLAWDAVIKQGSNALTTYSRPQDSMEKWSSKDDLSRPEEDVDQINTDRTRQALEMKLSKLTAKGSIGTKKFEEVKPEFVRYTPTTDAPGYNPACSQRIVKITEAQVDPMEPPRFKHMKVPRVNTEPPPPIVHSPSRKLTAQDQKDWKIPPCMSSWKNARGYTIPLDKRLVADGRRLLDQTINDKFAAISEDLYLAERKAREEIRLRNHMVRQKKVRESDLHEQNLREVAAKARAEQARMAEKSKLNGETDADADQRQSRQEIMESRKREIERDRRLEMAGKAAKRSREDDRDMGERMALGQQAQPTRQDTQYDSRLYNQSAGMDSGFGKEDGYNVFDKPLFASREDAGIYRHNKERMEQSQGMLAKVGGKNSFEGADGSTTRTVPVEFERDDETFGTVDQPSSSSGKK